MVKWSIFQLDYCWCLCIWMIRFGGKPSILYVWNIVPSQHRSCNYHCQSLKSSIFELDHFAMFCMECDCLSWSKNYIPSSQYQMVKLSVFVPLFVECTLEHSIEIIVRWIYVISCPNNKKFPLSNGQSMSNFVLEDKPYHNTVRYNGQTEDRQFYSHMTIPSIVGKWSIYKIDHFTIFWFVQ